MSLSAADRLILTESIQKYYPEKYVQLYGSEKQMIIIKTVGPYRILKRDRKRQGMKRYVVVRVADNVQMVQCSNLRQADKYIEQKLKQ